jgi:hypothetical protein
MRHLFVTMSAFLAALAFPFSASADDISSCAATGDLGGVHEACVRSGSEASDYIAGHADHTYSIRPACEIGGLALCAEPATCTIDGHDGRLYNVY